MSILIKTTITEIGTDAVELVEGGVLILFAEGAPPELAEVSVMHRVEEGPAHAGPAAGSVIEVGGLTAAVTAVGDAAWKKVIDIGHVVVNFNGAGSTERPGEICAAEVDTAELVAALQPGATIIIRAA
ncbi:PTS glucitol/sorbitol transporter subunit IIA [Chthonobacter albigriseus]|uniref:PTS glucitol/sorbitol transporter subunit IIA n=1 Tax=Chthonobacter albigriseus TaxID=1683161 RepID=UPI0015EE7C15|nr:PTS glucitol/sorbitol transporter subunit IIA [Chthonobacter albigriseus]